MDETSQAAPPSDQPRGTVTGKLVDRDGALIAGAEVSLFTKQLRTESRIGATTTDQTGRFSITYDRTDPSNLIARASDATGRVIAASGTIFAAPRQVEIELTTASDGIVRAPSQFTTLKAAISAALDSASFQDLKENADARELSFLAQTIDVPFAQVAYTFIAHAAGRSNALREETLFGLLAGGILPALKSTLIDLPDTGVDGPFADEVLNQVLASPRPVLDRGLSSAVAANIVPASYADVQQDELARLDALRLTSVGAAPHIPGSATSLNELLAAGAFPPSVHTAFLQSYAASGKRLDRTWDALRTDTRLAEADRAALNDVLSVGELLGGHLPLVRDTLRRLGQRTLASLQDLALLSQKDWEARIREVNADAVTTPRGSRNDMAADHIVRLAASLTQRLAERYPTPAFVGGLSRTPESSFATRDELVSCLAANPGFDLRLGNIDQFVAGNTLSISPAALAELKAVQRLHRILPHYTGVEALNAAGYKSAQSIYFKGRAPFLDHMSAALGGDEVAKTAFARAHMTYATALMTFGRYNAQMRGINIAALSTPSPAPGTLSNLPDLQALFGSLDYFQCDDCQSVYGPAAYLVDLLQYLKGFMATPLPGATPPVSTVATAYDALLLRRPEIQYVALSCANTNVVIPYIDLVNEILEAAIAPTNIPPPAVIDTEGTSAERRALPQQVQPLVAAAAYAAAAAAVFPLSLPFDLNFTRTTAYLAALGTTRGALLGLFPGRAGAAAIACAALGINPALQKVINQAEAAMPWIRWGLLQAPAQVIDPKTNLPYVPNPTDWVAALNKVPVLLNRSGLSLRQLYQLLQVTWVTQSGVKLQPGTTTIAGKDILSSDTDAMAFTGLDTGVLDRANRFLRLWRATDLKMWELDWAMTPAGTSAVLDDAFLVFLAGAIAVRNKLALPFQEVLSFWSTVETRSVTSHLGDADAVVSSAYGEVFANPMMLASWSGIFGDPAALSGVPIVYAATDHPGPGDLQPLNGIVAALGLSAADISAIFSASGTDNGLSLPTLTVLLRYARLAKSLSLSVADLILWIALTDREPFGGTPSDTLEFLRRLTVLQATGLAVRDLDYLLRGQSASQSTLTFTDTQAAAVLQTIHDAVAKAVAMSPLAVATVKNATPIAIGTAAPHGLATGTRVFITGARGATSANGYHAITVVDPSQFALNGTAGNADSWTGGGTVVANIEDTVHSIVNAALVTVTGMISDVVTPVLDSIKIGIDRKIGVVTAVINSIDQLLLQSPVDPSQFPNLIGAFKRVAKAGALFTALGPSPSVFKFVVQNARTFRWIDPGALPTMPVTASPYGAFELLLQVLKLQQRQAARTPKLLDVLGGWLRGPLPTDLASAIGGMPSLAAALNAETADVTSIATALGAGAPSLDQQHQPGTLADVATLTVIANALDIVARYRIGGATLLLLAAATPDANSTAAAMGALQAQYPQNAWLKAVQPIEDNLRQVRRDALVAYLLGPQPAASPVAQFRSTDDIFNYYLIDPEMCACGETTRLLQPSLAVQQFVQQCFLNLTTGVTVDTTAPGWKEWSWRRQFRLWQANRQVFLYPENFVLPEVRHNASPFFTDLQNDLRQSNCDADAAEAAFESYLRKLVKVSSLNVAAHLTERKSDGSYVLHVFACTSGTPPQWYYRAYTTSTFDAGTWSAWSAVNLDIASHHLLPVVWDRRLHLIWPVFNQISEAQQQSFTPAQAPQNTAQKFWAVQFAMSELSAGQWQQKRMFEEKMFFKNSESPFAYKFWLTTTPGSDFNPYGIRISVQYTQQPQQGAPSPGPFVVAVGTVASPDAPISVQEFDSVLPKAASIDLGQEPSFTSVFDIQGGEGPGVPGAPTPPSYAYKGQDLVWGSWWMSRQQMPVPVYAMDVDPGQVLLNSCINPRIVLSPDSPSISVLSQSFSPFFIADPDRTYLVKPKTVIVDRPPSKTKYWFETFYHPYARTFLRELETGGIPRLMSRNLQTDPQAVRAAPVTFDFNDLYRPQDNVAKPFPGVAGAPDPGETALDFEPGSGGAYSLYNWELFYHAPMFVASLLLQNQKHQDSMNWLKYIFDPTDGSGGPVPQRFWQMAPLHAMTAPDWAGQEIQNLMTALAAGAIDPTTVNAIHDWMADPFDPHRVASLRISAYGKATVMKFLDVCLAGGDSLYAQYTAETVSQAEQLYILADMLLGPKPDQLRLPASRQSPTPTYASVQNWDLFSNALANVENIIVAPEPPPSLVHGSAPVPSLPHFLGNAQSLLFCIPPNDQLLAYWEKVRQRLYNIRHCLNLQGVAQPLPLYAAPINPLQLIEGQQSGASASATTPGAPLYRFAIYLQKAIEIANDVRGYGASILSALEKQDAETLSALRANQELNIQTRILDVKQQQTAEAQDQITALQNQQAVTQIRLQFYSSIAFMNEWETAAIALQGAALIANGAAVILDMTSGSAHLTPSFTFGAAGFGGSPMVTTTYGGDNIGSATEAWARVSRSLAGIMSESGGLAATMGSYQRRQDEWTLQANLAKAELVQIGSQIAAATDRLGVAKSELSVQNALIANAQAVNDFLTSKYTNARLYNWMITQLTTVYTQAYQLAFSLALQAQAAYQYELGRPTDRFIQFAYWDNQHKGLTAGDSLLFDLRRMEAQYLAGNLRELELTKHVSLALTQPSALVQLLQTGSCSIALDEALFDRDYPGQYFRRIRSVALTIPCVSGPYTGVNATLSLAQAVVRTLAPSFTYKPWIWGQTTGLNADKSIINSPPVTANPIIATSSGQGDAGLFEINLRDERWLPFEGQGAVSSWTLSLDPRDNNFDLSSVTDVILHVRYTARAGGDAELVRTAIKPINTRSILVSVRNTFADAYYSFFNPADSTAPRQALTIPLTKTLFPFSNLGTPSIANVTVIVALAEPLSSALATALGNELAAAGISGTFGLTGSAAPAAVSLKAVAGATPGGGKIAALSSGDISINGLPASVSLIIPQTGLQPVLETTVSGQARLNGGLIDDIVLLVGYKIV
jgi:hypothetical protein